MNSRVPVVTLEEWDEKDIPGMSLTPGERIQLQNWEGDRRVVIEELRTGLRIKTTSWVGVVSLSTLEVRIVPKLPGTTGDLVRLLEVAADLSKLRSSLGSWGLD